jgi:hypothetical protein
MPHKKLDGVVEAVHYRPDGMVDWVRAYERRGPTFSDFTLLNRQALIERLKAGKRFYAGKRLIYLASTFEVSQPLRLVEQNGNVWLVTGETASDRDWLDGVPVI